ncbi:MAG TPA: hypothetical protein VGB28_03835 [Actinomycetota bacterium]|jgi:hypothetical protein
MSRMTRMTAIMSALAMMLTAPQVAAGAGGGPSDYAKSVGSSMDDNRNQYWSNVTVARNILCTFVPFDTLFPPGFHGAGSGSAQPSLGGADTASFTANCWSPSFPMSFRVDLTYRFQQYLGSGTWADLGSAFQCSTDSVAAGGQRLAHLQVPGTPGCSFVQSYAAGDPSLTRPHRLQVELTVLVEDGGFGPRIKGWSVPWPMATPATSQGLL